MIKNLGAAALALSSLLLFACNVSDGESVTPSPCANVDCSDNGSCETEGNAGVCACNAGFAGDDCSICADGFNLVGDDCVANVCPPDACSGNGTCDAASGACTCNDGYTGQACDTCADGFVSEQNNCVAIPTCATDNPCGDNAACEDSENGPICLCNDGYAGESCDTCATTHYLSEDGTCLVIPTCAEVNPCSAYGNCTDSDTGATCLCQDGYTGSSCDVCAETHYFALDGTCQPRETCDENSCNLRGTCDDSTGPILCVCDPAYGGDRCAECYPGYVALNGECVVAEFCQRGTCFGNGVCDDSTGFVSCTCNIGYAAPFCDACAVGHTGADCLTCLDGYTLINNVCTPACADGKYVTGEACDDGNTIGANGATDFCAADCATSTWPDGTWPGFIPATYVNTWVTWKNTVLAQNSSRYMKVAPGSVLPFSSVYSYDAVASGCAGCVTQLYLAFYSDDPNNMDPLDGAPQFCKNYVGTSTDVAVSGNLTAPTTPGTYYLRWYRGWDYQCNATIGNYGSAVNMFAIYVE